MSARRYLIVSNINHTQNYAVDITGYDGEIDNVLYQNASDVLEYVTEEDLVTITDSPLAYNAPIVKDAKKLHAMMFNMFDEVA